jgi:hypothetical protein
MVPPAAIYSSALAIVVWIFRGANPIDNHRLPDTMLYLSQNVIDALRTLIGS